MKRIFALLIVLLSGCLLDQSEVDPSPIIITDLDSSAVDLTGVWSWKYSSTVNGERTPETDGYKVTLIVGPGHYVEVRKQDVVVYKGPATHQLGRAFLTKWNGVESVRFSTLVRVDGEPRFECIGDREGMLRWWEGCNTQGTVLPYEGGVFERQQ